VPQLATILAKAQPLPKMKHAIIGGIAGVLIGYYFCNYLMNILPYAPIQPAPTVTNLGTVQ